MTDACGSDFGTSDSTAGWRRSGHPALLVLEGEKPTLPSVGFVNSEDDTVSFDRAALASCLAGHKGRLMGSWKSLPRSSPIDGRTEVSGRALSYRSPLSKFIAALKHRAERATGREFTRTVPGRPVSFVDGDADTDRPAGQRLADSAREPGFTGAAFQYEAIAARASTGHLQATAFAHRIAFDGAVAQLGECRVRNAKVGSSILLRSTIESG